MNHMIENWEPSREAVMDMLQERGVQPTQQRVEIAQYMFQCPQHLSAEQVLAGVNRESHRVSKATVYNTLGLFAEKGLVREVIVDRTRVFYDSNTDPHHHFYNVDTGMLTDIAAGEVQVDHLPSLPEGTEPEGVEVIVRIRHTDGQG